MPDAPSKHDLFKPAQPNIPGLNTAPKTAEPAAADPVGTVFDPARQARARVLPIPWIAGASAVVVLGLAVAMWSARPSKPAAVSAAPAIDLPATAPVAAAPAIKLPIAPGPVATTDDLSKPWSARKFIFENPATRESSTAMVVHLPGGTYWAISMEEPFGKCQLQYVSDLQKLRSEFDYAGDHPMVVDPCNRSVFDLARYGTGPNGLVRGEVVQGPAIRPPLAIEIRVEGRRIIATRSE
jgi:hypothetical protein